MSNLKVWFSRAIRSKTINTAVVIAILGIIQDNKDFLSTVLTPKQFGWVMIIISVVMIILRVKTIIPLEKK